MKFSKLLLLLLISNLSVFGQKTTAKKNVKNEPTLEETQKWIKTVIDEYGTGTLKFEGSQILYDIESYPETNTVYNQKSLLKEFSIVKSSRSNSTSWITMSCNNGKCVYVDCKDFNFNTTSFNITLSDSISDDMLERLLNSFKHLLKLSSNTKIDNTF